MKFRSQTLKTIPARFGRALRAFRQPPAGLQKTEGGSLHSRQLDANAANLIMAHGKVMQILEGEVPLPEVVELFITNFCDFACPHCRCAPYRGDNTQFLNVGTLEPLLIELSEKGVKNIELGGGGEPLVHPQIGGFFQRLNEHAFRVGLITNGYRFTEYPDLLDLVSDCSDWVRFSLDGISDGTFRIVHGRRNVSYDTLREAIVVLVGKSRAKPGVDQRPKIGIKLIIQKPNQHEILPAVDEALALGVDYLQFKFLEGHAYALGQERFALLEQLKRRIEALEGSSLVVDILPGYGGEERIFKKCRMAVLHPLIDWDGTIYMCAFFHHRKERHSIGNINDGGFFVHWGTEEHKETIKRANPRECVPNCPLLRYDPVIDFIASDAYRFPYI